MKIFKRLLLLSLFFLVLLSSTIGLCQEFSVPNKVLNAGSPLITPSFITTDGTNLYIVTDGGKKIQSLPVAGGSPTPLYGAQGAMQIAVAGENLYWIDPNSGPYTDTQIWKAPKNGSGVPSAIYTESETAGVQDNDVVDGSGICTDGTLLYAADEVQGRVVAMDMDGSGRVRLDSGRYGGYFDAEHINTIAIAGGSLYIADEGKSNVTSPGVFTLPSTGGAFTTVHSGSPLVRPFDIAVSPSTIFIADYGANTIWIMPREGGEITPLVPMGTFNQVLGVALYQNRLFVTDNGSGLVYEIDISAAQWVYTYGDESVHDYAYSIQQAKDGGYIVAGIKNYSELWILKLDTKGQAEWQKSYGGPDSEGDVSYEHGFYVRQTIDGGYIVAGGTKSFGAGSYDFWVLKLDTTGTVEWQKTYGGAGYDYATSIQQTGDGGYVIAGITQSFPETEPSKIWVLKLKADGTIGWQKVYGVSYTPMDVPEIQATSDGGYILGTSVNNSLLLLELAGDGSIAWQKTYKEGDVSSLNSLRITKDGGYIVAGWVNEIYTPYDIDPLGGKWDGFWLLKLNSEGAIIWQKTYGETQTDDEGYEYFEKAYSVEQTADGGYVVAGSKSSKTDCAGSGGIHDDIWILKLNSDGSIAWQKAYGGDCGEKAYSIVQTSDGGYAMAGYTDSFGAGGADAFILKIDPNGEIPACSAMGTSNAIVIDTSASEPEMSVVVNSTDISPAASNASITDTSVAPLQVCGQILTPLKGDLNNDQAVDLGDIILALQVSRIIRCGCQW